MHFQWLGVNNNLTNYSLKFLKLCCIRCCGFYRSDNHNTTFWSKLRSVNSQCVWEACLMWGGRGVALYSTPSLQLQIKITVLEQFVLLTDTFTDCGQTVMSWRCFYKVPNVHRDLILNVLTISIKYVNVCNGLATCSLA